MKLSKLIVAVVGFVALTVTAAPLVSAGDGIRGGLEATGQAPAQSGQWTLPQQIAVVTNVLLFVVGAVAVIMIIIGGIRYVVSNGDSNQVTSAKNTILYAVIGIVVALLAFAIANFVINQFTR